MAIQEGADAADAARVRMSRALASSPPPSLLPAFEPVSSSPSLPRPLKRKHEDSPSRGRAIIQHYPTPLPTSSTAAPPSSPQNMAKTRPMFRRTASTLSERQPLSTVPSVILPLNGEPVLMGRSSNSSHYQLSSNRLISRVHVSASYHKAAGEEEPAKIVVACMGWNGCKVHCRGSVYDLGKGDTFSSDKPQAQVMLDVQDARVLLMWPAACRSASIAANSDATWDEDVSPPKRIATPVQHSLASSPPQARIQLESPVSPSPAARPGLTASSTFLGMPEPSPARPPVLVYEDAAGEEDLSAEPVSPTPAKTTDVPANLDIGESSSSLSAGDDFSDVDEENDPIVHSFGVFGASLLPRMANITASSPDTRREPLKPSSSPQQRVRPATAASFPHESIRNHVINQLAFSRLHSLPLSTIMGNLPASMKHADSEELQTDGDDVPSTFTEAELKKLLDSTPCVGEIVREGKDAAGKALEDEFYYVPEMDSDTARRDAVENSLGKPGLRAVRKQHKQYFWKRPRH